MDTSWKMTLAVVACTAMAFFLMGVVGLFAVAGLWVALGRMWWIVLRTPVVIVPPRVEN